MNILFLVLGAGIGGHVRSAMTIGHAIARRGNKVVFVVPRGTPVNVERSDKFIPFFLPAKCRDLSREAVSFLTIVRLAGRESIDVIATFDGHSHLLGYCIGRWLRVPAISTVCGGQIRHRYPYTRPVIVFSHELQDTMVDRFGFRREDIIVEPARIAADMVVPPADKHGIAVKIGVDESKVLIGMVGRLHTEVETAIVHVLKAVGALATRRNDFTFVHVGAIEEQGSARRVAACIQRVNDHAGRTVAVSNQSMATEALRFMNSVDILCGRGRAAFEGMLCQKPIVIVGGTGFAGIVGPDNNVHELAYYNFSGRNARQADGEALVASLARLIDDVQYREQCARVGSNWVRSELNVEQAASTYLGIYEQALSRRKQTHDSWLRVLLCGYGLHLGFRLKLMLCRKRNTCYFLSHDVKGDA